MDPTIGTNPEMQGLRERNVALPVDESIKSGAMSGEITPEMEEDTKKEKKTFGRTPDGTSQSIQTRIICWHIIHQEVANCSQFSRFPKPTTWSPNFWILDNLRTYPMPSS
jgi:hypothetical protein